MDAKRPYGVKIDGKVFVLYGSFGKECFMAYLGQNKTINVFSYLVKLNFIVGS